MSNDPHQNQPVLTGGVPLDAARVAVILLHGRGSSPDSMLALASRVDLSDCAVLAPAAAQGRWYPRGFMEPTSTNEPDLSSALARVTRMFEMCVAAGIPAAHVVLGGFSQGACLAAEWAARNPQRLGGLVLLSGGLIGAADEQLPHAGSLDGTPVFVGCSERDPWIPMHRVQGTAAELARMDGIVSTMIFAGAEHSVRDEEVTKLNAIVHDVARTGSR